MQTGGLDNVGRRRDLDGLRGVAVLLIIFLHYISRSWYFSYLGPRPVALLLDSFWSGVDIFFVLSGFLIGGIILDNGRADNFSRVFYLRRALRIFPVRVSTRFGDLRTPGITNPLIILVLDSTGFMQPCRLIGPLPND
jgi:peptidoglycan/LPS O-acetylase OafA/YrhL